MSLLPCLFRLSGPSITSNSQCPALRCRTYPGLIDRLRRAGVEVKEVDDIPEIRPCHIHDPFGNRIELIS